MAGYLRATWIALPMLAFYPGPDAEPFRRAVAVVKANFSPDWEGSYLAWLLRCLQDARLPAEHPLVARCLADLKRKQRLDGSWEPEGGEGEEHTVNATVMALRVLKGYEKRVTNTADVIMPPRPRQRRQASEEQIDTRRASVLQWTPP